METVSAVSVIPLTRVVNRVTVSACKLNDMGETLAERAARCRIRAGFKTPKDAADAIGCGRSTVAMWETSGTAAIGKYLYSAARAYKVRPEWLNSGNGPEGYPWNPEGQRSVEGDAVRISLVDEEDLDPMHERTVSEVDVLLSAGPGNSVPEFVETTRKIPFQMDWFYKWNAHPDDVRLMRVRGDSMERFLFDGDRVAVHLKDKRIIDGKLYAVVIGGESKVKRLFMLRDGSLRVVSENKDKDLYPDEIVPPVSMEEVYIIGRVIDKSGGGGL